VISDEAMGFLVQMKGGGILVPAFEKGLDVLAQRGPGLEVAVAERLPKSDSKITEYVRLMAVPPPPGRAKRDGGKPGGFPGKSAPTTPGSGALSE
jgi:hypothetical protein